MDLVDSSSSSETIGQWIYLFYEHYGITAYAYTLYKIDVNLSRATTVVDLSPSLDFPNKDLYHILNFVPTEENPKPPIFDYEKQTSTTRRGMRCVRLGSKLYFVGGTNEILEGGRYREEFPKDVHVLDMLTNDFKTMDASLNAGKPYPCAVFAANGKLYAIGSIPTVPSAELSRMKLFECFDPTTGKWEVLDNIPPVGTDNLPKVVWNKYLFPNYPKRIEWEECTVFRKRQQVVLQGCENTVNPSLSKRVTFVYHIQQGKWTRHNHILQAYSLQEGGDNDYLYGLAPRSRLPLKLKSVDVALLYENRLDKVEMSTLEDKEICAFFGQPYYYPAERLLCYLENDYLCYIACGMCQSPDYPDSPELPDPYTRGITISLFKEKKNHGDGGENLCFQAEIMHSQHYRITGRNENTAQLVDCFVVDLERLQKKLGERKDKKKKKTKKKISSKE